MASPTLKFKRGALADLPTLAVGEPGFTTDKYQLYVGSPSGNQLIGGGNFWNLESNTEGGGLKLYEATNNGTNYVELQAPDTLGSNLELTLPSSDASADGQVLQSNASGVLSFGEVAVTHIDIDGATDIGADIVDDDLFIVDDSGNGTNRRTAASRIKTYVLGGSSGATFSEITVGSAVTINSSGIHAPTGVITASNFSGPVTGNVTGDLTGNADTATTATNITVADESSDTTCFPVFTTTATGNRAPKTDSSSLTYNSSNGTLSATTFSGALTGDVTGNADSATTATNITVADESSDTTCFPVFTTDATGDRAPKTGSNLTFNSSSGALSATSFVGNVTGDLTGTADDATILENSRDFSVSGDVATSSAVSFNGSSNVDLAVSLSTSFSANTSGIITASSFVGDVTGNSDTSGQVKTIRNSTDADQFLTFVADDNLSATAETVRTDAGIKYNPGTNLLTVAGTASLAGVVTAASSGVVITGIATADTFKGTNAELTGYIEFDGAGVQVDGFVDEDNMSSNSATKLPTQQSVKAYVDTEVAGVAVTFAVAGDSGSGIVTTGTTLTIQGTSNEVDTSVSGNTVTIGLPNTVNITTELNVPTVDVGALRASDGTAAQTIADSTGKVTTSTDHEVQGTFTAAGNAVFQGNTDIGNATADTLTVTARVDSNFVPSTNGARDLGSSSLNWDQGFIDRLEGDSANLSGIATANTFKGVTLDLSGNGEFGGNVTITGNLSVGGSVTNIDVEDLRVVSPIIELGLQRLADGTLQPPASVTTYKPGVAMYYNHVGVSSANAKIASVFAKVQNGGDMRIGFATDISITAVGAGDSVTAVNAWADIEAKGLWINDCAGQSQVISCTGSTRNLENITVDGGSFS